MHREFDIVPAGDDLAPEQSTASGVPVHGA
jgi:hypothetical protein